MANTSGHFLLCVSCRKIEKLEPKMELDDMIIVACVIFVLSAGTRKA